MSELVTGEAVPLELRLAKLPSRAISIAIDLLAMAIAGLGLFLLLAQVVPAVDQALAAALVLAGVVTILVVVPTTVETLSRGKSLGKVVMGLRVVRDDGGPVRFRHAMVRALAGVFADFVITLGAGAVICSILNERGKRIGDVLAGTVVLRERIPVAVAAAPVVPSYLAEWAGGLELSRLPDSLALAARTYLARMPTLSPRVRQQLGDDIARSISAVVSPQPPAGIPAPAYVSVVLAERHRREALRLGGPARAVATGSPASAAPGTPSAPSAPPAPAPPAGPPAPPVPAAHPAERPAPPPGDGGFAPPA